MSKTQPARGMRDFLPSDVRKRNYVINIIKEVYESYGFEPLETPAVENLETLTGKYGEEGGQLMFKILKRGEKLHEELESGAITSEAQLSDLALRYDLTVPLARVVANYRNELPRFFKRYQIQPVWRADRPARGRYREFYQCDVDAIGSSSMIVEAELISAVCEILQKLGFRDFVIRINHREILRGMLEAAGVSTEKHTDALVALDKIDKIGREGVEQEFKERGIVKDAGNKLLNLFQSVVEEKLEKIIDENSTRKIIDLLSEIREIQVWREENQNDESLFVNHFSHIFTNYNILTQISEFMNTDSVGQKGISDLRNVFKFNISSSTNLNIKVDPTLARGLTYYTGAIFEINVPDLAGSLGGGGRYDGLIGMFGKEQIPACGFSLGLERILVVMEERGMFPPELSTNAADVLVTVWNEESAGESLKLANELRAAGLRVLVYPQADKFDKQLKYASQIDVPFVCIIGDDELRENKVTLKNMQSREQETVARGDVAVKIK